jgi:hypothetical protein
MKKEAWGKYQEDKLPDSVKDLPPYQLAAMR